MKDGDVHRLLQRFLNVEALGRLDVFQVDATKGRLEKLAGFNDLVSILGVELDVEDIDVGEAFEQDTLAFHDGLARQRADIAKAEHRRSIGDYCHEIALGRVLECVLRILLNLQARVSYAGRVRETKVALGETRLRRNDLDLTRP